MIETVDGSALYVHSAEQVNQMCTKSHFFPVASAAAVRQAAEASLAARVTGGYSSSSRACSAARTGAVSWYSAASRVDGAIALVNSRQRGGEIGLFTVRISAGFGARQ